MLIQFNFKNFKSFREEAALDLSATKMTEFSDRVVAIGGEKVLPVAAIYGANASGKSNIYNAFGYMSEYVVDSFKYGDEEEEFEEFRPTPFLFDSTSADAESSFEVYFTLPGDKSEKVYNYGFCVDKEGVTEEWLNSKAKTARKYSTVFYRGGSDDELDLSGFPKSSRDNIQVALEKQVLIISLGAKLKVGKCKDVRDWFLANEFADFGDPVTNFFLSRRLPKGFVEDKNIQQKVVNYLASFDEHIKEFIIENVPLEGESKEEKYKIYALHKKIDSDEMVDIPLELESAGTLKMFALYPELQEVLAKGSVFFVDELNARLHPLLVRNFLLIFLNPEINENHAQLLFTTHDTWQLSNQLLRRDEIWFVEKDNTGLSSLYSLADFVDEDGDRIRKDENYEKNYLLGKYGAIPELRRIDILKEEQKECLRAYASIIIEGEMHGKKG
ncbi:MAG: ATP-binding protein [Lachnospiraceae bacterium]|nr:ATP-binding protein [Lachnospiraceae bacterium]